MAAQLEGNNEREPNTPPPSILFELFSHRTCFTPNGPTPNRKKHEFQGFVALLGEDSNRMPQEHLKPGSFPDRSAFESLQSVYHPVGEE